MEIIVIGLNYRTAPVEIRETASVSATEAKAFVEAALSKGAAVEAMVLTTCNRTEFYGVGLDAGEAGLALLSAAASVKPALASVDKSLFYTLRGREAVEHLARVACGLDSQVLGEDEIIGQVREAFDSAAKAGGAGLVLSKLGSAVLAAGGRTRSETALCRGAMSVSSAAVDLARKVFRTLENKAALVIGAGTMARLACACLKSAGVSGIVIANRSLDRAKELASAFGGRAETLESVPAVLPGCDLVISAVGGGRILLALADVEKSCAADSGRTTLIIDISVPRSVDPAVGNLDSVYLKSIDDLNMIIKRNAESRAREVPAAEAIAAHESGKFMEWFGRLSAEAAIAEFAGMLERIRKEEVGKALRNGDEKSRKELDRLTRCIMDKIIFHPASALRRIAGSPADFERCTVCLKELFGLNGGTDKKD